MESGGGARQPTVGRAPLPTAGHGPTLVPGRARGGQGPARGLLTLNAGQSSVKAALFEVGGGTARRIASCVLSDLGINARIATSGRGGTGESPCGARDHAEAADLILAWAERVLAGSGASSALHLGAVGHRVTHGGIEWRGPVLASEEVLARAARYAPLVPLHQPHNLAMIRAVAAAAPDLPQVLCFDTAFHATIPDVARRFALPRALIDEGVVRYGFHGLSYEHVVEALPRATGAPLPRRLVVAHLGAGASMCAIRDGASVACTLGMTGMDGLPMGTRAGSVDPGVLLYLLEQRGMTVPELSDLLWRRSGLLGVSGGISSRMQDLLASPDPRAREAVDLFVYRVGRELGSLAASLDGLDGLVFTGGIGERSAEIRAAVCAGAGWLGVDLDPVANLEPLANAGGPGAGAGPCAATDTRVVAGASPCAATDGASGGPGSVHRISSPSSRVAVWAMLADEEAVIARHTIAVCPGAFEGAGGPLTDAAVLQMIPV